MPQGIGASPRRGVTRVMRSNITAIIPVYNGRRYLREAVESVANQTLRPDRLIIIDDGSTDGSTDVLKGLTLPMPLTVVVQANCGQAASRNRGIALADTEFIALLDQDDAWYPRHCEVLIEPLRATPDMGWAYSNCDSVDQDGALITSRLLDSFPTTHPKRDLRTCLSEDMFILPAASLIRKSAIDEVGGFDEQLVGYEDDDLFLRLFVAGWGNAHIPDSLSFWRMHDGNTIRSRRMILSRRSYAAKLMAAYPDRPERNAYFVRDCIAPRFYALNLSQYKWGLLLGDLGLCREVLVDMRIFAVLAGRGFRTRALLEILKYPALILVILQLKNACAAGTRLLARPIRNRRRERKPASQCGDRPG